MNLISGKILLRVTVLLTMLILLMFSSERAYSQQPVTGFPYTDSFKFPTSPGTVFGGANDINLATPTIGSAFLTASQTAVTTYGSLGTAGGGGTNQLVTADQSGGGYLRLTRTVQNQTGYARNMRTFPTSQGLSISFEYYTYGNVADGIVFFLYDADVVNRSAASNTALGYPSTNGGGFQIGAYGGSLGYAQRTDNGQAGLSKGFLGIGFDEFGNFGLSLQGRQGGYGSGGGDRVANWVTLRGDGDGTGTSQPGHGAGTNYEYLIGVNTSSTTAMASRGGIFNIASTAPASRTVGFTSADNGYRKARIIIEYITASQFRINVYVDQNSGSGLQTHHVIQDYIYNSTEPAPANLSYGFSASTGGSTNVHEIRAIDIAAPLSVAFAPVATPASTTTLEDNAVSLSLIDYAYDQNGNSQLNWATGLDLDPSTVGVQASRTIPGQGTFTSNASGTVTFTPLANYNGTVSTDYTIADFGNASPTIPVATSNAASLTITVTPVNDAPTAASKTVTTNEDVPYVFTAADFSITDAFDNPQNTLSAVQITTLPASGTLLLAGVPVVQGASITLASINAASFTYSPPSNASASPMTSFNFRVQDNGGTANGGVDLSVAAASMTINVLPVNDPPAGIDKTISTNEDVPYTFQVADFGFTDAFDNPANGLLSLILSPPGAGSLTVSGVPVTSSTTISAASITSLVYTPPLNSSASPTTTFTFQVRDDGGTANGGVDLDPSPNTITINVVGINDAPSGTDKTIATNEDLAYTFVVADFGFTDAFDTPPNNFQSLIVSPVSSGSLTINGVPVSVSTTITAASVTAGSLVYTPAPNANGSPVSNFTFQVRDDGGTANGGVDLDPTPNTISINVTSINDAPSGTDKTVTTNEDVAYVFTATDFGFSDAFDTPPNNFLSVIVSPVAAGSLTLDGVPVSVSTTINAASVTAGLLVYTPAPNANGSPVTSFTFQVKDDGGTALGGLDTDQSPNTISINVTAVNDLPVVADIPKAGAEDATITFTALDFTSKFTDVEGDALTKIKVINLPANGLLKLNGVDITAGQEILLADLPNITFVPTANFNGSTTFKWNGFDGTAYAAVDEDVNITITPVNDLPVVADIPKAGAEDATITFTALDFTSKFTDVDGDALTKIKVINLPANGLLKLNGVDITAGQEILLADLPNITFVPTANFNGSTTFKWNGFDGTAYAVVDEDVNITITPVNDLPVVADIPKAGAEDATITFTALDFTSKFTDVDGDALTKIKVINLPANGLLKLNGVDITAGQEILLADLPNITFVPTANFNGSTTFKWNGFDGTAYAVVDEDVNITITPVNDLPVLADIPKTGLEDAILTFTALDFTSKFTDADGNTLTKIKVINLPANGLLKLNGTNIIAGAEILLADLPNITFVPTTDFNGSTTFKWNAFDGTAYAAIDEDVNITITAVNDAPSFIKGANQAILTTAGAQTVTAWATSLSKGPADEASQTLTFTVTNANNALFTVQPTISSAGVLTYTPSGTAGTTTVTVVLKDNGGTANGGVDTYTTQTFTITITAPAAGNNPPVVDVIPKVGTKDSPVPFTVADFTSKFTDADSNPLSKIRIVTLPPSGTLKLNGVDITVNQEIPLADLANISFVPATGFTGGPVTFQWNGSDGTDYAVTPKDVNITIYATNAPPVAVADAYSTVKGGTLTVAVPGVLSNDSDADANPISAIKVTDPSHGTLTLNPNGSFTYVHNNGTSTSDSFTYKVYDGIVDGNTVTVTITINATNTPPVIVDIPKTGIIDQPVTFTAGDFTSKFTDPNGDALNKIRIVTLPPSGTLRLNGLPITLGQEIPLAELPNITFIPPAGFSGGPISFQWNGSDGTDYAAVPKNVNITIDPTSITISVTEVCIGDVPWVQYTITGLGFTPAANSATIRWKKMDGTIVRELTNQALTGQLLWPGAAVDANGIPTAWPGWSFTGGQWVQISDGLRPQMRLHISINLETEVVVNYPPATPFCSANPNRPPVVTNISKSSTGFLPIPFTVNDFTSKYTDPDGDPLVKIKIVTLPANGTLKLNGVPVTANQEIPVASLSGLTFEPALNWSGTTNFTWNGSDGDTYALANANAAITVIALTDPNAKIGLAKNLASVTPALNGTYDVKFIFTAVNYGPNGLDNVSIRDNLALAFGGTQVVVKSLTAFGGLKANTAFNGIGTTELLLPTSSLTSGEEAKVELLINVKLTTNVSTTFQNTAIAEAVSSITGLKVTDVSTNGLKPDPNVAGDVSSSLVTPIQLDAFPTYVPQGFSPNGDGMNDKFVIQNANGKRVALEIYNRWGNRVYKSDDYRNDWGGEVTEGFFLGRDIPDGTYYYIIIIDNKDKYAGFITINR